MSGYQLSAIGYRIWYNGDTMRLPMEGRWHMLDLTEWLKLVGLEEGNPFAYKQADAERAWLQACFVAHPAYNALAYEDEVAPRSSILHAARGAGKTSACMMYEQLCRQNVQHRRSLIVRFDDWMSLVDHQQQPPDQRLTAYLQAIFRQVANSLVHIQALPWLHPPADTSLQSFLAWFCTTYGDELTDSQLSTFTASGRFFRPEVVAQTPFNRPQLAARSQLSWLLKALTAVGWYTLVILVDRVDEVDMSVDDAQQGADLLLPLVANLPLLEADGLVFKFFVPSEIVAVLRERKQLRDDRIRCDHLDWSDHGLLRQILQNRLRHFSAGRIDSLAALAAPELRDIDDRLVQAANHSPRTLLLLAEQLMLARVATADSTDLLIQSDHLAQILAAPAAIPQLTPPVALVSSTPDDATAPAPQSTIPLLRMGRDGTLYRGDEALPHSANLPRIQRACLRYLFSMAGTVCHYSELGREIWDDETMGEDNVRKVMQRLMRVVNDEHSDLHYIERRSSGLYILQHAEPLPLDTEPLWNSIVGVKRAPRKTP
ncbi:MAG: winged helix family transcriptional regulator [Candidatus Viridilinea halotolerans]|uniref:Winged helix family transcriptional regulator n=1 Tax=Candidatus Viridilinea halotolerans TaxID=2491704 RepID=A0A426U1A6_9CHLR|nr:MAG: winged helix family transcriptional regulator [Candidatus Viridilinea halotolerans]